MDDRAFSLPLIILAAGASSRMGARDKLLEEVDGVALLRRQALMARQVTTGPVLVALPPAPHPRYAALTDLDVTLLPVQHAADGMNVSLGESIKALADVTPAAMVLLADMPALRAEDLRAVLSAVDLDGPDLIWRGVTEDGKPGHPIVFAAALFDTIKALDGDSGAREVVASAKGRVSHISLPGNNARLDLDTPEDWAAFRAGRR